MRSVVWSTNVNDVSWRWAGFQICHMRLILPKLVRLAQTPSEVTGTCKMKGGFGVHCVCHLKRNEVSTLLRKNQLRGHADTGTSHRIPSHHLTSHRTTSHGATSHHITAQHITSRCITSHHSSYHPSHGATSHHYRSPGKVRAEKSEDLKTGPRQTLFICKATGFLMSGSCFCLLV